MVHCDLKVASSSEKIDEKFSNYFLKTKANNKGFKELKRTCKGQQKTIGELEFIKSKPKALRHFKVDPVFLWLNPWVGEGRRVGGIRVKELSGKPEPGCWESTIYDSIEYVKDAAKFIFNPSQKKKVVTWFSYKYLKHKDNKYCYHQF